MAKTCQKVPKDEKKRQKSTTTKKCVKEQPSICLEKNYTDQEMSHVSWIGTLELNGDA